MRKLIVPLLHRLAQSPRVCRMLDNTLVKTADFYKRFRLANVTGPDAETFGQLQAKLALDLTVLHGPFKGMQYPGTEAAGSAFIPKLLGSYEKELQPILEHLLAKNYTAMVDIGCAEGYYAVGIARRLRQCRVTAYDLDPRARDLCQSMAKLNGVTDNFRVETFCDAKTLENFAPGGKSLIICDCEAYEKQLFTPAVRDALRGHDILIEMHDFLDITISSYLIDLFKDSHKQTRITSVDDLQKARDYDYPELAGLSLPVRRQALAEDRPRIMEWLILESLV
jgi:SAM-dependent methyltransferase